MSVHLWEEIVRQIERESDRVKVVELAKKLNEEMIEEETEKVRNRLGISPNQEAIDRQRVHSFWVASNTASRKADRKKNKPVT